MKASSPKATNSFPKQVPRVVLFVGVIAGAASACGDSGTILGIWSEGISEAQCADGLDNDFDGEIDCVDDGCATAPACTADRDGGVADADRPDAGANDGGTPGDVATSDAGRDTAPPDTEPPDTEPPDTEPPEDTSPGTLDRSRADHVCERWRRDRSDLREGAWSGDAVDCDVGDLDRLGRDNTLRQVNLARWLAWLDDDVRDDDARNANAQACAVIMHANGLLDHHPPASYECFTSAGADEAGRSNLSPTPAVEAIDLYMADPGNDTTLGHRRWILSNGLAGIGIGSTSEYSCLGVIGGSGSGWNEWTSWPAPGPFPIEAVNVSWSSVDDNGWSIQSDTIDLGDAEVTIYEDGLPRPVTVFELGGRFGSTSAIRIALDGWGSRAGSTYTVEVDGVSAPFAYEIEMVTCE